MSRTKNEVVQFEKYKHYNPELESAIIGACMLETTAFARVCEILKAEMFYQEQNRIIYLAIHSMFNENMPIDLLTVCTFMVRSSQKLPGDEIAYVLTTKIRDVVSTAHLEYHAIMAKQMWLDREMIRIRTSGVDSSQDGITQLQTLQQEITNLSLNTVTNDWADMSELMVKLYEHQDSMMKTQGMGKATGFRLLDREYGGFHDGQVIVLAARPSVGKSAMAGQFAVNMAAKGIPVGIISLEMNNVDIAARIAAIDTSTDFSTVFRGLNMDEIQRQNLHERILKSTANLPIYVSDATNVTVMDIKAKAYKLKQKKNLGMIIVDYLQLVDGDETRNSTRENVVSKISRGMKIMAKELNIPILLLAQLNREVDKRKGESRYPQLSDLRESGAIEQDADVVMFLHSDYKSGFTTDEHGNSTENKSNLIIRKWRNGRANVFIDLEFDGPTMRFTEPPSSMPVGNWKAVSNQERSW